MNDRPQAQPLVSRRSHWVSHLERHAHGRGDRAALRFQGETTTWQQLHDRVESLAASLADLGVGEGDRVGLLMGNRPSSWRRCWPPPGSARSAYR